VAPERPGISPSSQPGRPRSKSTKLVIQGFDSRHRWSFWSKTQRTERALVSSNPSIRTGPGAAGEAATCAAALTTSAR